MSVETAFPPLDAAILQWLDEQSTQGFFITDERLNVRSWNGWLARMTGKAPEMVIGRPLFEIEPSLVERGLGRYYEAALRGQSSMLAHRFHGYLIKIPGAHGEMPQSCRIAPLVHKGHLVGTITVIDDVSERVHSEVELRRQIAGAEEARASAEMALRVKDEFLATLSHELRTPLNAVLGWTNLLQGGKADPETLRRALQVIERNTVAQARLVDDMLDMARIVTGKLRLELGLMDLIAAAAAAIDVVSPSISAKRLTLTTDFGNGPKLIMGDAARIQQIVWNVLSNAVKFTPPEGTIDVRIDEADGQVRLTVTDSGKGIAPEFLPHVFERFRQANSSLSRSEGGLGLGLALVRQLVDLHGGDVQALSEGPGRGTRLIVTFPALAMSAEMPAPAPHRALTANSLRDHRVLVVDDDLDWREALGAFLQEFGAEVISATRAEEALTVLNEAREPMDAILVDIGLPEEDGYSLVEKIRRLEGAVAQVPVIAVTAYSGLETERRVMSSGFDAFRAKPIAPEGIAHAILEVSRARKTRKTARPAR